MNKSYVIILLVVAVGFLIFPFVAFYGNDIMVVTSNSMVPALNPQDLIIVKRISIDKVKAGDIIAFDSHIQGIGIIAHRAIQVFDDDGEIGIYTKGDHVEDRDSWIIRDTDLIGKVINVLPTIGIFLIEPVRYSLVAVIIITAISLLKEISSESKLVKKE